MANRLNVLVGAILDGNVAKDLNKELKSIEGKLEALSIRASFDGDFKAVVEAIQKAVSSIDLSILNNGLDSARNSLVNTSKEMQNLGRVTEKSNKVVTDLQGNLKTVERTVEGMDGKEVKVKFVADKDGGFNGDLTYTDTTGQKSISEARKAEQYWLSEKTKANEKSAKKEEAAWRKYYSFLVKSNTEINEKEIKNAEKTRLAEEKAQNKLYSQKLRLSSNIEEQKRQELIKTQNAYEKLNKTVDDLYKYSDNDKVFGKEQAKEVDRYKAGLKEVEAVLKKENVQYSELISAQKKLTSLQNDASSFASDLNKQVIAQDKLTKSIEKQKDAVRQQVQLLNSQKDVKKIRLTSVYGDLFKEEEFDYLYKSISKIDDELEKVKPDFKEINAVIKQINSNTKKFEAELSASHKEAKKLQDEMEILDSSLGRFVQFYWFGELFRLAKTGVTEMVSAVSDLDSAMIELKKVTNETDAVYKRFMTDAAKAGKRLGVSMSDYIESVTEFSRMGYDFEEAQQIAETANIMQMVSENLSADDASSYLISIMRGFNIAAEDSMSIIDALNNVDRRSYIEIYRLILSSYRKTS